MRADESDSLASGLVGKRGRRGNISKIEHRRVPVNSIMSISLYSEKSCLTIIDLNVQV